MQNREKTAKLNQRTEPTKIDSLSRPVRNGEKLWPIYDAWRVRQDKKMSDLAPDWPRGRDHNQGRDQVP